MNSRVIRWKPEKRPFGRNFFFGLKVYFGMPCVRLDTFFFLQISWLLWSTKIKVKLMVQNNKLKDAFSVWTKVAEVHWSMSRDA